MGRFLEEVVKDCGPEQEQIAKLVLYLLTDENNTRPLKTRADLELELDVEGGKLDLVLKILVLSRLVFLIPATPADRYQLVHDYLVEFVRKEQSAQLVQEIEKEREMRRLTEKRLIEVQRQELFAARRARNNLIGLVASISCFALVSVMVGFNFYLTTLRLAAAQKWGPNQLVETLKVAKLQKRFSWLALPEIRRNTSLSLAEAVINMGKPVNILEGHTGRVTGLAFHPQSDQIATSSRDKTVKLWEVNGKIINTMEGHSDEVEAVTFNNQGNIIASGSKDSTVRLWTLAGEEHQVISSHSSEVTALDFSSNDKILASADKDGNIQISNLSINALYNPKKQFPAHVRIIKSLDISPDNQRLASVDIGGDLKIWTLEGELIANIDLEDFPTTELNRERSWLKIEFSKTGNELAVLALLERESSRIYRQWIYDNQGYLIDSPRVGFREFSSQILQFESIKPQILQYYSSLTEVSQDDKFIARVYQNDVRVANLEENFGSYLLSSFDWLNFLNRTCQIANHHMFCRYYKNNIWVSEIWNNSQDLEIKITSYKAAESFDETDNLAIFSDSVTDLDLVKFTQAKQNILKRHSYSIQKVFFSPDKETIIAIDTNNSMLLIKKNYLESVIPSQDNHLVRNIQFNSNGDLFAVFDSSGSISIWNKQGIKLFQPEQKEGAGDVSTIVFSPDSQKIAFIYSEGLIDIFSRNGDLMGEPKGYVLPNSVEARFSPDSKLFVFSGGTNVLHAWDFYTDSLHFLKHHNRNISDFEFSSDDKFFFSIDAEMIKVWNLEDYSLIDEFEEPNSDKYSPFYQSTYNTLFISPKSNVLVSQIGPKASIWKIQNDNSISNFELELLVTLKDVSNFRFSADEKSLFFVEGGTSVKALDLDTKVIKELQSHNFPIDSLNLSNDGKHLISISYRRADFISIISRQEDRNRFVIDKEYVKEYLINLEDDSPKINSTVKVWNLETQNEEYNLSTSEIFFTRNSNLIVTFEPLEGGVRLSVRNMAGKLIENHEFTLKDRVNFNPNSESLLLSSNKEHYLQLVGIDNSAHQIGQHSDVINEAAIHPKDKIIASASDDQTVKLWNFDGELIQKMDEHQTGVKKLIFSPNGELIASASDSQEVFVWNLQGELILRSAGYQDEIWSLVFSPDSKKLAIADTQSLKLLNIESEEEVEIFDQPVSNVLFSKNGKVIGALVAGSPRLWSLDGTLIKNFSSSGTRLSFSEDDQLLLLGSSIQSKDGIFSKDDLWRFWRLRNLYLDESSNSINGFSGNDLISVDLELDSLLEKACTLARGFLVNNPNIKEQDRRLCDGILEEE